MTLATGIKTPLVEIRTLSERLLRPLIAAALVEAAAKLAQSQASVAVAEELSQNTQSISDRFSRYLSHGFDVLSGGSCRKISLGDYPALSLVDDEFVEAANALEGMVNYARTTNVEALVGFNTRMNVLFDSQSIDETNSPLDPARIAEAFVDALAPLQIDQQILLSVYRCFNQRVLHQLHAVLEQANGICSAAGLLPDLVVEARSREALIGKRSGVRPTRGPLARTFSEQSDNSGRAVADSAECLYRRIQQLLKSPTTANLVTAGKVPEQIDQDLKVSEVVVPSAAMTDRVFAGSLVSELGLMPLLAVPGLQIAGREVTLVPDWQLILLLDEVQDRLIEELAEQQELTVDYRRFTGYLGEALLGSSTADRLYALSGEQLDKLLTVNLMYDAFCQDVSLIHPIKELIAATQVVMMKLALNDVHLFADSAHPVRLLLNEVAAAGVGAVDQELLKSDPVFVELETILIRLVTEYDGDTGLVSDLLKQFSEFKTARSQSGQAFVPPSASANEARNERLLQLQSYVSAKIEERIQEPLHPLVDNLVRQHFQRFLMIVLQRDGQGSHSWMLVIKILDLLLWTVRSNKQDDDRERFDRLNPLLLPNIRKVLRISGLDAAGSDNMVERLIQIQERSFALCTAHAEADNVMQMKRTLADIRQTDHQETVTAPSIEKTPALSLLNSLTQNAGPRRIPDQCDAIDEELQCYLAQVDRLPVGSWLAFQMQGTESLYCSLAARLPAVDKLVFTNNKGVKVLEKTRQGLAEELQQGSVRIVSEWPLFERGMESVVARLRERQQSH